MTWPNRGDVCWIDLAPVAGHEQGGRRPVVIISKDIFNLPSGLILACPVTSRSKGYRFEVPVPAGLPVSGVVLANQGRTLDWRARNAEYICTLPESATAAILERFRTLTA